MKPRTKLGLWFATGLAGIGLVSATVVPAQTSTITLTPGTTTRIECETELHITPESPQAFEVVCDPVAATATNTTVPATATNVPTNTPAPAGSGIWLSPSEIAALPASGAAWTSMVSVANGSWGSPNLGDNNSNHDVMTLTGAFVAARTNSATLKTKVADAILSARETENGSRTLELSRNLVSYVIAADVIDLKTFDPAKDAQFRTWLGAVRNEVLDGRTIITTHEDRPNNWGTMAGAARVAAARYLGDTADVARAAVIFHGWLGDRTAYAGFDYGELDWQCNPSTPVGVNPVGCTKEGHNIDGVLPEEQRRTGGWTWPAPKGSYPHEALQGAFVQAQLLHRAGFPAWEWENQALRRAYTWLYTVNQNPAGGDDSGYPFLINRAYGSSFAPGSDPHRSGKNMCCLSWTHGS